MLLDAKKLASQRGVEYSVVLGETTGEAVRRMFEMTGLGGILPVVERDEAAPRAGGRLGLVLGRLVAGIASFRAAAASFGA